MAMISLVSLQYCPSATLWARPGEWNLFPLLRTGYFTFPINRDIPADVRSCSSNVSLRSDWYRSVLKATGLGNQEQSSTESI